LKSGERNPFHSPVPTASRSRGSMMTGTEASAMPVTPTSPLQAQLKKPHPFESRMIVKMDSCVACGKRIAFGKTAFKCRDCRSLVHPECRPLVPLPCVPAAVTPKQQIARLDGFVPPERPMIPAVVVHCVLEVERRGLSQPGIYRIPGADPVVKELLEKFLRGKGLPKLGQYDDVHVVASCLKHFLRKLKEPLVTHALWGWFARAAEVWKDGRIDEAIDIAKKAVSHLPPANVDTMAFIVLHLIRVSDTPACKMSAQSLAKVFGPLIIGYSSSAPEAYQMLHEPRKQCDVLEMFFAVPSEFWEDIIGGHGAKTDRLSWQQPGHPFLFGPR